MGYVPQKNLDRIRKDAQRVQELARELSDTRSPSEARKIRLRMAELSREIEEASRAAEDYDKAMGAAAG